LGVAALTHLYKAGLALTAAIVQVCKIGSRRFFFLQNFPFYHIRYLSSEKTKVKMRKTHENYGGTQPKMGYLIVDY
jgi:hypothetical protein